MMTARASSSLLLQCHSLQRRASWHLSQHYNTANDRERSGICFSIRRMLQQLYIHRTTTTSSSSSSASPASSPSSTYCITFLTDVEGDGAYFDRFIEHSKVLGFRPITPSFGDSSRSSSDMWNLGKYDVNYFPYDKEVIFLHHTDDNNDNDDDDFNSNSILVYGGDTWDKGNGSDLYVMRQLLSLQVRHPHRVYLLMGNRDINKMRIVNELVGFGDDRGDAAAAATTTTITMPKHNGAYWLLRNREPSDISPIDVTRNTVPNDNIVNRLQWMLQSTMGSKDAFELRRIELLRERITFIKYHAQQQEHYEQQEEDENSGIIDEIIISDMEVVQSYIQSCCPNSGIMSQYLSRAKLALRIGPVLFLHGALPLGNMLNNDDDTTYFPTPWISSNNNKVDITSQQQQSGTKTLTEWINALDEFASQQVKGWKAYGRGYDVVDKEGSSCYSSDCDIEEEVWCTKGGYFNSSSKAGRMFGALLQYGMGSLPNRSSTQSCIYNSWMHNGMPRDDIFGSSNEARKKKLCNILEKDGIRIILSGHQPVGDAPWPILITSPDDEKKERKTWILPCDTSFSGDTHWTSIQGLQKDAAVMNCSTERPTSGRGNLAFSEPLVHVCSDTNNVVSLTIHGCLSDGSYYKSNNMMITDDDDKVGQKHGQYEFKDIKSGEMQHGLFWFKGLGNKGLITCGKGYNVWNSYTTS